jgi:two-component system, LuxR family, response regulator FixJ
VALSCSVYIVEDDEAVARSLSVLLQLCGYHPHLHATADPLLAAAAELPPGCLLIDYSLPGTNGLEVLDALRERGFRWPAILMTGHELDGIERDAKRAGVRCVLEKPFDTERLAAELEAVARLLPADAREARTRRAVGAPWRPGEPAPRQGRSLAEA